MLYPSIQKEVVDKLNSAAYTYFQFLISLDSFVDAQSSKSKKEALLSVLFGFEAFEEGIRKLTTLYNETSPFWEKFNETKKAYFKAILDEKSIAFKKPTIDEALFQEIAVGKSLMCHNSVYALSFLANDFSKEDKLISCINHIHIAFQYLDDIDDFKQDIRDGQWTYLQSLLRSYFTENDIDCESDTDAHKHLFISGIAQKVTKKAIEHYEIALGISQKLKLTDLITYINEQICSCNFYLNEVAYLFEKTRVLATKSNEFVTQNTLENAIYKSLAFLKSNQNEDGSWSDFMTSAGTGKAWITGYVGSQLAECFPEEPLLNKTKKLLESDVEKLLAYNDSIFQDGDSTTFVLSLANYLGLPSQEVKKNWFKYQHSCGGWQTYIYEQPLRKRLSLRDDVSVTAWLSPKICVSAAAALVLRKSGNPTFNETAHYLTENVNENGYWESYWWTSPVYATSYTILSLSGLSEYRDISKIACNWLVNQQQNDGSLLNPSTGKPNAFYTALGLKALFEQDKKGFKAHIDKGIEWLLNNQTTDGSWQTGRILRIPATDMEDPKAVKRWRNSSFGVNCISDDYNRVFTTSAVLNFLATYKNSTLC